MFTPLAAALPLLKILMVKEDDPIQLAVEHESIVSFGGTG